jgi:DNA polymerase III alpha subunit (gram-positive type)
MAELGLGCGIMKYLFFDIECANCFKGKGKICEFGYILTDENFTIISEESIKINPSAPFDVKGFAMRGIKFEKPFEYYRKQPSFKDFYSKIKELLQAPDYIVVGHGVENDARYLIDECERYKLPNIDFKYCDTCELAKIICKREKGLKLEQIYKDLCHVSIEKQPHRSLEDAFMTMEIAKVYVDELKQSLTQIREKYKLAVGESLNGRIVKARIKKENK